MMADKVNIGLIKVEKVDEKTLQKMGVRKWPIWEKEQSEFTWEYETTETFLVLTGDVTVTNEAGKPFHFKGGDYVIFPEGMKCTWKIHKAVRKHYKMG